MIARKSEWEQYLAKKKWMIKTYSKKEWLRDKCLEQGKVREKKKKINIKIYMQGRAVEKYPKQEIVSEEDMYIARNREEER